jgi:hypothetical protein
MSPKHFSSIPLGYSSTPVSETWATSTSFLTIAGQMAAAPDGFIVVDQKKFPQGMKWVAH